MDKLTPAQQEAALAQLRQQAEMQTVRILLFFLAFLFSSLLAPLLYYCSLPQVQQLMVKMTEACFKKCAGSSGNGLDYKEQSCSALCMDRYMETMNVRKHFPAALSNNLSLQMHSSFILHYISLTLAGCSIGHSEETR